MRLSHPSIPASVNVRAFTKTALALGLSIVLSACAATTIRSPAPEEDVATARPYGVDTPGIRLWGDAISHHEVIEIINNWVEVKKRSRAEEIASGQSIEEISLALSGGGPDGAFGAGLLNGWTERGDRPEFTVVTGISTGAIIALFAFLGPEYDDELKEVYTTYSTDDLLAPSIFSALRGGTAFADASGYRDLIEKYVDDEVMRRLVEAHDDGRVLLVGTTNLDAARPVMWSLTKIASTGHPNAKTLIRRVIQASSAIPGFFPPVIIPVETPEGRRFDELHVDGGATQQVMLTSPEFPLTMIDDLTGADFDRTLYVIMNNKLVRPYEPVSPTALDIAGKAVSTLISGSGSGDIYKIFAIAQRDDIELNVLSIPTDFNRAPEEPFDPAYMQALYKLGYDIGFVGESWLPHPVDYAPKLENDLSG